MKMCLLALSAALSVSYAQDGLPRVFDTRDAKIRVVPVATGLYHPWSPHSPTRTRCW